MYIGLLSRHAGTPICKRVLTNMCYVNICCATASLSQVAELYELKHHGGLSDPGQALQPWIQNGLVCESRPLSTIFDVSVHV